MKKLLSIFAIILFIVVPAQQRMKNYNEIMKSKNIYEIDAFLRDAHDEDPRRTILKARLMDLIGKYIKDAYPDDQSVPKLQEKLALLKKNPSTKITFEEMTDAIKKKQRLVYERKLEELKNPKKTLATSTKTSTPKNTTTQGSYNAESYADAVARANAQNQTTATVYAGSSGTTRANVAASSMMSKSEEAEFEMLMNESPIEHKNKTVKLLNKLFDNDPNSKDCIVMIQNKSDCNMIVRIEGVGNVKYRLAVPAKDENSVVVLKGDYLFTSQVCGAQYASQKTVQKAIMVALNNPGK